LYFSDEGERYDSEGDVPPPRVTPRAKEYKDTESFETEKPVRNGKKPSTPTRKIDLGAAANYGKTQVFKDN
jgi:hypothetical protein